MKTASFIARALTLFALGGSALAQQSAAPAPAASAFDRLKSLAGDWIDTDGAFGKKGDVAVTYRITGGGSAVVETLFAAQPHQMTTIYHKDGSDIVLTHYCAAGNQPRMRARTVAGNVLEFAELEALRRGYSCIDLHTNEKMTESQLLYSKIGYAEYDRRTENGYARVYLRKQLRPSRVEECPPGAAT